MGRLWLPWLRRFRLPTCRTMGHAKKRAIRWTIISIIALMAAYWVSPYVAAVRLVRAADRGDAAAVQERLDLPRIRNSFARQIVRAYPVDAALLAQIDPAARYGAGLVAITYVDAIIADYLNVDVIARLLTARRNEASAATDTRLKLPAMGSLDGAWDVLMSARFKGATSFAVDTPPVAEGSYRLGFRLIGGTWRLVSIGLPTAVVQSAIAEFKRRSAGR